MPGGLGVASAEVVLVVYPLISFADTGHGRLINVEVPGSGPTAIWNLTGFFTLGAMATFASRSKLERI